MRGNRSHCQPILIDKIGKICLIVLFQKKKKLGKQYMFEVFQLVKLFLEVKFGLKVEFDKLDFQAILIHPAWSCLKVKFVKLDFQPKLEFAKLDFQAGPSKMHQYCNLRVQDYVRHRMLSKKKKTRQTQNQQSTLKKIITY